MRAHRCVIAIAAAGLLAGLALAPARSATGPEGRDPGTPHASGGIRSEQHIVWSQFVDFDFSGARIMISDIHGHHTRQLTHPRHGVTDTNPEISPNGRRVVFERDLPKKSHVVVIGIHGEHRQVLPGCNRKCLGDSLPSWTPDGHHLLVQRAFGPIVNDSASSARLWKTDLDGQHFVPVSNPRIDGRFEDFNASFAPAGYIVFARLSLARDQNAVFRMNRDGSHVCRLTPWKLNADTPDVSPAAKGPTKNRAVFETYGHNGPPAGLASAVATVKATCGSDHHIRYLTSPHSVPVWHFNPGWSPHATHLVFVRFKSVKGDPIVHGDIVTSGRNGKHREVITHSPLFDFRPDWGVAPK